MLSALAEAAPAQHSATVAAPPTTQHQQILRPQIEEASGALHVDIGAGSEGHTPPMASLLASDQVEAINARPIPASASSPEDLACDQAQPSIDAQHTQKKAKNQHPKLFLDLFSGVNAPLTAAMQRIGADHFAPFDLDRDSKCNILDDTVFKILMRTAWSGLLGVVWSAPPCKEFSRLKLRPGGPKALRTPDFMDGVPHLNAAEQARVDASTEIFTAEVDKY